MDVEIYISGLSKGIRGAKRAIIEELWGVGDRFPGSWVPSPRLLKVTGQKYFDRRIRELRDELGCDIEMAVVEGVHSYRIKSQSLAAANPRLYLTSSQKKKLLQRDSFTCKVCGRESKSDTKRLQADHKVPLIRRGDHADSNWQILCVECNVAKRGACRDCELDCKQCPWAFPEEVGVVVPLRVESELLSEMRSRVEGGPNAMERWIIELIKRDLG